MQGGPDLVQGGPDLVQGGPGATKEDLGPCSSADRLRLFMSYQGSEDRRAFCGKNFHSRNIFLGKYLMDAYFNSPHIFFTITFPTRDQCNV